MTDTIRPVPRQQVKRFTLRFADLLDEGHSLAQCLATAGRLEKSRRIQQALIDIQFSLMRIGTIYEAMAEYPDIFDDAYVDMVREGARQGRLAEAMRQHAETL